MNSLLLVAIGYLASQAKELWGIFFFKIRLSSTDSFAFYYNLIRQKHFIFQITQYYSTNQYVMPRQNMSFHWCRNIPFVVKINEMDTQGGLQQKEAVCFIEAPIFYRRKLVEFVKSFTTLPPIERDTIQVKIYNDYYYSTSNKIKCEKLLQNVILNESVIKKLDDGISDFNNGKRSHLGILLYGSPGNGKTSIVKQIAARHCMDVYVPTFNKNSSNAGIIRMFSEIPNDKKVIVLFEDFDNVFNGRTPIIKDAEFSFDVILNCIDGILINTENMIFIMTTNNLEKIDKSLKNRPSRFDLIINIENPTYENRLRILESFGQNGSSDRLALLTEGQSAAVVSEIAKHRFAHIDKLESDVKEIINSFNNDN